MAWAHIENKLDDVRKNIKNIDQLKKQVNHFWNRIPKKLCRKICLRFQTMLETVNKNKGNKENRKDRRDKKPIFRLSKINTAYRHKYFEEYEDNIERIAYSTSTMDVFKKTYSTFLKKEIAFLKKVLKAIGNN
jgi:hypothetical protein